jgi:diguanylate cyclase (GGDEF)-like protein
MIRDEITYGESQKNNLIGRYGGEEILFLLRNVTSNQAIKKVESIRNMIAHFPVQYYDNSDFTCHDIHVTCSFGVLHVPGCKVSNLQKTGDIHDIMQKTITLADKEVYRAKEDGRNNAKLKLY